MHKNLKSALVRLQTQQTEIDPCKDFIITSERNRHVFAQTIVNFFQDLYKRIGFEGCSSHSGRRTFITNAAKIISQAGGTLNDVRILAGHTSLLTTQRYIEYDTNAQKKIIELL